MIDIARFHPIFRCPHRLLNAVLHFSPAPIVLKKQASEIRMPELSINYQRSAILRLAVLAGLIAGCYSSVSGSKSDLVAALHHLCVMYTFGKVYALYYSLYTVGGTFIMDMSLPL